MAESKWGSQSRGESKSKSESEDEAEAEAEGKDKAEVVEPPAVFALQLASIHTPSTF